MPAKPAPTPKRYAKLKKEAGRKGTQKDPEAIAVQRVMRHRKVTAAEAKAYIVARTAEGKSVAGFVPSAKQRKVNLGSGSSDQKPPRAGESAATRAAIRRRMAEQKGNITNKPQGRTVTLPPSAFVRPGTLGASSVPLRKGKPPSRPVRASKD